MTIQHALEQMDTFAVGNATIRPFRYLDYCGDWQKSFEGCGEENLRFLWEVSWKYDPNGWFQKGSVGRFKLGIKDDEHSAQF